MCYVMIRRIDRKPSVMYGNILTLARDQLGGTLSFWRCCMGRADPPAVLHVPILRDFSLHIERLRIMGDSETIWIERLAQVQFRSVLVCSPILSSILVCRSSRIMRR